MCPILVGSNDFLQFPPVPGTPLNARQSFEEHPGVAVGYQELSSKMLSETFAQIRNPSQVPMLQFVDGKFSFT